MNFRKTYDTVNRELLYESLRQLGLINAMFSSLAGSTPGLQLPTFLINGEQSDPVSVFSGIRLGYPLASLLFLLAVKLLGIAIQQLPY